MQSQRCDITTGNINLHRLPITGVHNNKQGPLVPFVCTGIVEIRNDFKLPVDITLIEINESKG